MNQGDGGVPFLRAKPFEVLSSSLGQEDVLLPKSPVLHNRTISIHLVVMLVIQRIQMMMMVMVKMMVVVLMMIQRIQRMMTMKMIRMMMKMRNLLLK